MHSPARSFGFEPLRILEPGRVQLLDVVEGSELLDILQSWNVGDGELTHEEGQCNQESKEAMA